MGMGVGTAVGGTAVGACVRVGAGVKLGVRVAAGPPTATVGAVVVTGAGDDNNMPIASTVWAALVWIIASAGKSCPELPGVVGRLQALNKTITASNIVNRRLDIYSSLNKPITIYY
jgi:hypothetical protein